MWERLKQEIRNPLSVSGWIMGFIGLIWGFYSWAVPSQISEISYKVDNGRIVYIRHISGGKSSSPFISENNIPGTPSSLSNLKVINQNGEEVTEDIRSLDITIWNSGSVDIGSEKIRRLLSLEIIDTNSEEKIKLSGYTLEFEKNDYVDDNFHLFDENDSIFIKWKNFDPGQKFRIRVFFLSNKDGEVRIGGNFLGVKYLRNDSSLNRFTLFILLSTFFMVFSFIALIIVCGILMAFDYIICYYKKIPFDAKKNHRLLYFIYTII